MSRTPPEQEATSELVEARARLRADKATAILGHIFAKQVTLGGETYTIVPLPIKQSHAWRDRLAVPFNQLTLALEGAADIEIKLSSADDIVALVRSLAGTLIGSIDTVLDLLFAYSPVLAEDRERIENEAYDTEAIDAFIEVVKLAYPLGRLVSGIRGPQAPATTPNGS